MRRRDVEQKWHDTWIADFVVSVVIGLSVTVIRWLTEASDDGDQSAWPMIATFVGTTAVVMIVVVRKRVAEIEVKVREHNWELSAGEEIDYLLMQLQVRLREVQAHRSAVFKTYCKNELENFVSRVARVAQQGELMVKEHHFRTVSDVLEAFGDSKNRVFRAVWKIEEDERLFDTAWQHYMKELIQLTKAGKKRERITVELLLVVDRRETLDRTAAKIVVGYLRSKNAAGINYRIISEKTLNELVRDSQLNPRYIDFGVYGEELLYRTETYEPKQGIFSEDKGEIRAYQQTHEAAMRSARALADPKGVQEHDNLERFLQADEYEEKECGKKREGTVLGKLVKIETRDKHLLDGILYEADGSIATVLHVHGSLGNFYHQSFIPVFARILTQQGINLLSFNMRTHDGIAEGYDREGEMTYVGGSLVRFETCVEDIHAAVRWSKKFGRKVYLQGHSLGCDRVLHYLESTNLPISPILLSPCDSHNLQKEWLGEDKFLQQETKLRKGKERRDREEESPWALAPRNAYGLSGGDGWTYEIPVTENVLESIQLGAVGRILAIEKEGKEISRANAIAYLGTSDPIRGASLEAMSAHLEVLLPRVEIMEGAGDHNMEGCEEETAIGIAAWIENDNRESERTK